MKKTLAEMFEHDVAFEEEEEEEAIDDSYIMKEDWIRIENIYVQKQSITACHLTSRYNSFSNKTITALTTLTNITDLSDFS